jgi:hypothetical protein
VIRYTIPMLPPSLNAFLGRSNAWAYRAAKREWLGVVAACCRPAPAEPMRDVSVTIRTLFADSRRRDADNLAKFVLDGLVAAGIIEDDSWQCVDVYLCGGLSPAGGGPATEIEIRPRNGGARDAGQ